MLVFYLVQHLHHHCIFASLCSIARDKVVKREFLWQRIPRGSSRKISWLRRAGPRFLCRAEFVRSPRGKIVEARSCGPAIQAHQIHRVRLAEWSKAPDLSSGSRERAWVRTPHLTIQSFAPSFRLGRALISVQFPILRAGRVCVVVAPRCDAHLDAFGSGETKQSGGTFIIARILANYALLEKLTLKNCIQQHKFGRGNEMTDERGHFLSKANSRS